MKTEDHTAHHQHHMDHDAHNKHATHGSKKTSINKMAASATLHCLIGCAIGEVAGLIIGTALGWDMIPTMILAIVLAFISGFTLSAMPIVKVGVPFFAALSVVFASDALSITTMEIVDNSVMAIIPGAMNAGLFDPLFWISMVIALAIAYVVAYPVNRYLLSKGKGHALIMKYHKGHSH